MFRMELVVISLMVSVGLFKLEFGSVDVGWQWWFLCVMVDVLLSLVVGDGLFKLALWVSLVVVGLLIWMALLIRVFAGGWLLGGALMSVFARRWRIYCMMLVDGSVGLLVWAVGSCAYQWGCGCGGR